MAAKEVLTPYGVLVFLIAAFSGFLFGYHTAVISGALVFLSPLFNLTPYEEGVVVSIMLLGGLVGSLFAGLLADRFGRKKTMLAAAFLIAFGAFFIAASSSYNQVVIGRTISGVAIGVLSVVAPLYLAELAPPHFRGRCVSAFQLLLSLGVLFSFIMAYVFSEEQNWQILFSIGALMSLLQICALCFIPESPSWTMSHGMNAKTIQTLSRCREDKQWENEIEDMSKKSIEKQTWASFRKPHMIYIFILGCILSAFQQITGINAVIYYTPKIFNAAGIASDTGTFLATMSIGVINCLATLLSVWVLDKIGRRLILLIGSLGMAVSLSAVCYLFFTTNGSAGMLTFVSLMGYVGFFAFSLGPAIWVLLSEIFPLAIRGNALASCLALNWLANYAVSFVFPHMIKKWGGGWSFGLFAALSLAAFVFVFRFISETKGKSLEEIEALVTSGKF